MYIRLTFLEREIDGYLYDEIWVWMVRNQDHHKAIVQSITLAGE
jgi:hypothetical protein